MPVHNKPQRDILYLLVQDHGSAHQWGAPSSARFYISTDGESACVGQYHLNSGRQEHHGLGWEPQAAVRGNESSECVLAMTVFAAVLGGYRSRTNIEPPGGSGMR